MADSKFAHLRIHTKHHRWSRRRKKALKTNYLNVIIEIAAYKAKKPTRLMRKQGMKLLKHTGFSIGWPIEPIHAVSYASQPEVQIACTRYSGTPTWKATKTPPPECYELDSGDLYTFKTELVTCDKCKGALSGH